MQKTEIKSLSFFVCKQDNKPFVCSNPSTEIKYGITFNAIPNTGILNDN